MPAESLSTPPSLSKSPAPTEEGMATKRPSPIPPRTPDTPTKVYAGGCHCGKFAFECRHPLLEDGFEVVSCNCSICTQRGYLVIYILNPAQDFRLLKGTQDELTQYKFGANMLTHMFCPVCGSAFLAEARTGKGTDVDTRKGPHAGKGWIVGVNVRAIQNLGVELDALTVKKHDGRSS